jgi:hypothetical protein
LRIRKSRSDGFDEVQKLLRVSHGEIIQARAGHEKCLRISRRSSQEEYLLALIRIEIASAAAGAVSVKPSMVLLLRVLVVDTLSRSRKSHIGVPFIFIIFFFIVVEQNALFRTRFTRANIPRWN